MKRHAMIIAATVCGASLAIPEADAAPPGGKFVCATSLSGNSGVASTYTDITTIDPGTQCKSSIILAFDSNMPVLTNVDDQIQLAVDTCGLWDGPYRRLQSTGGNPNYDYVVMQVNSISSSFNTAPHVTADAAQQIGVPGTLRARFFGTTSNNSAVVSFIDESHLQGDIASQTLDYPGPEFLYMLKAQGGGGTQATLLCAVNAWFWSNIPTAPVTGEPVFGGSYGISSYPVQHNVNQLTAGWGAGPSGLVSKQNINSACASLNNGLTQAHCDPNAPNAQCQFPNNNTTPQHQYAGKIYATYKTRGADPAAPTFNVTNCAARDFPNEPSSYERVCSSLEPPGFGRPNSCNPDGGVANGVGASIVQTQSGHNSHCAGHYSFKTGFGITSYGSC